MDRIRLEGKKIVAAQPSGEETLMEEEEGEKGGSKEEYIIHIMYIASSEFTYALICIYGTVSSKITLLGSFSSFQIFFIFRELQRASIKWSLRILIWTIYHKVIRH